MVTTLILFFNASLCTFHILLYIKKTKNYPYEVPVLVSVSEINIQSEIVSILGLGFSISSMQSDSEGCKEEILTIEMVSEILGEMAGVILGDSSEN